MKNASMERPDHRLSGWSVLLACCLLACGGDHRWIGWGSAGEHTQGSAKLGGSVVSTVDGVAITVEEVQALVNATGLSPRAAMTRLQSQALLMGEAQRRGYADNAEVQQVARQALVQALLARDVESVRATNEEIAAAYDKQRTRFHTPERRGSVHVLARFQGDMTPEKDLAAQKLAEQACSAFALVEDPSRVLEEFSHRSSAEQPVSVEHLPAVANDGSFVPEFMQALFSTAKVGPVPQPVRTQYGWHAIYVTEITPAHDMSLAEATPTLRAELELEKQKQKLASVLASLRRGVRIEEQRQGEKALGALEL